MGEGIRVFNIKDDELSVDITNFGATITSIKLKDKNGELRDVVLGFDTPEEYENDGYFFGATIGRVANRIAKAQFVLNGNVYKVSSNQNGNCLHGGINGFNKKIWDVVNCSANSLELGYLSPDGEEGFPGNLKASIKFTVVCGSIKIEYYAETDKDTVINLTNHSYFNLAGEGSGNILDTIIFLDADYVSQVKDGLIPNGEIIPVKDTPFDFKMGKAIGRDIDSQNPQLILCGGYDTNYILNGKGFRKIAFARNDKTGISMNVYSDSVGVQFYSGNFLNNVKGKNGHVYMKRDGFCLETQNFPNDININKNSTTILRKGEKYYTATTYEFVVK